MTQQSHMQIRLPCRSILGLEFPARQERARKVTVFPQEISFQGEVVEGVQSASWCYFLRYIQG